MRAANEAVRPGLGWRIATVLGVIFGLYILAQDLDWLANLTGLSARGDIGVVITAKGTEMGSGRARVTAVVPGSSAAAAGIAQGDILTFEPHWREMSAPGIGERVEVTVSRDGAPRRLVVTAGSSHAPAHEGHTQGQVLSDLADIPSVLLGLLILIRSRFRPAPVLLGLGMIAFGMAYVTPSPSLGGLITFLPAIWLNDVGLYLTFAPLLAFALVLLDSAAGGRRWRWLAFTVFAAVLAVFCIQSNLVNLGFHPPLGDLARRYRPFVNQSLMSLMITLIVLAAAWWRAPTVEKHRVGLLAAAFACIVINQGWFQLLGVIFGPRTSEYLNSWPTLAMDIVVGVVAPILFAYAILRHRVLDLGFALNRTLVYSVVSAILLGAFGQIEWAIDHFVKIEGREQNALIDAAIALVVFLTFHRVRDFVEHAVETLFFRAWQEKEVDLRRFVSDAAFVTRRDALLTGFVGALRRFADGADCAVYMKAPDGRFARAAGELAGAPRALDPDEPAVVRLRAERKPVEPDAVGSALTAALLCPLLHRDEVIGAVLMAPREAGGAYRPDEADLLGWAAQRVGIDLHALEVEQLQASVSRLQNQLEGARLAARPA